MYQNVETRSRMISSAIWEKKRWDVDVKLSGINQGMDGDRDDSEYGDLRANLPSSYPYQYVGEKKERRRHESMEFTR